MSAADAFDVIVVGGGLSGCRCADKLISSPEFLKEKRSVLLLEASERLGGRLHTTKVDGKTADLGGMWVGPTQHRLIQLAAELGVKSYDQYTTGKKLLFANGKVKSYSGLIPPMNVFALIETHLLLRKLNKMARQVPLMDPYTCSHATQWDALSAQSWIDAHVWSRECKQAMELALAMTFGAQSREISFLYFLFYVHAAGGIEDLFEVKNGAQEKRFTGGTQQLCEGLAARAQRNAESNPNVRLQVRLNEPVVTITHIKADDAKAVLSQEVQITTASGRCYRAKHVIVAVPPHMAVTGIRYEPPLPFIRQQLSQRAALGSYTKAIAFYDKPFWRQAGFSGETISLTPTAEYPILSTYDYTDAAEQHWALVSFLTADVALHIDSLPLADRQTAVLRNLARLFGPEALKPSQFLYKAWAEEKWTRGCPVALFPAGSFARHAQVLRQPVGVIHWAATDTATQWTGYMEGALQSAERAAAEVIAAAGGQSISDKDEQPDRTVGWVNIHACAPGAMKRRPQRSCCSAVFWTVVLLMALLFALLIITGYLDEQSADQPAPFEQSFQGDPSYARSSAVDLERILAQQRLLQNRADL